MDLDFERAYGVVTRRLPPTWAARVDLLRPSFRDPWGGPMNGQTGRQAIIEGLCRAVPFQSVLETGTFRGTTTEYLAQRVGVPVRSVEALERNYVYACSRLADQSAVQVDLGDSREVLRQWVVAGVQGPVLCYLDAHWEEDLPLSGELDIIANHLPDAVVVIDDFEVRDDAGYGFDDYGEGRRLDEDLIDGTAAAGWARYLPALPSQDETGARRGCIVLAGPAVAGAVAAVPELRSA